MDLIIKRIGDVYKTAIWLMSDFEHECRNALDFSVAVNVGNFGCNRIILTDH